MNSKIIFAFILAVNICTITTAQVYSYKVAVSTAYREFDSHEGKLKLSVMSNDTNKITREDYLLTPNDVELKRDSTYTAKISSIAPLDHITSVYLRWTLATPNNTAYATKKPTIYVNPVKLKMFTLLPLPSFSPCEIHIFYPETFPIGITNEDEANFKFGHIETDWIYYYRTPNVSRIDADC
ncbi:uncharacterized protein LOC112539441 [Tetranychus urticae]|uniref:Uncharacterized protein n=1 Tax=Tetranychus urticae TaxID=32264 RepID=T1KV25_TETUR|nr:uncharacterized protein LOC112539441 [Tetranychus urticae]